MKGLAVGILWLACCACATVNERQRVGGVTYLFKSVQGGTITIDRERNEATIMGRKAKMLNCSDQIYDCMSPTALSIAPVIYLEKKCKSSKARPPVTMSAMIAEDYHLGTVLTYNAASPQFLVGYHREAGVESIYYDYDGNGNFARLTAWELDDLDYLEKYRFDAVGKRLFGCLEAPEL